MIPGALKINFPAIHDRHLVFWPVIRRAFTQSATVKWPVVEIIRIEKPQTPFKGTASSETIRALNMIL